jgi:hypothetical protein
MPVILAADLGGQHPGPSQRPDGAIEHGFQVPQVQLHHVIGHRVVFQICTLAVRYAILGLS